MLMYQMKLENEGTICTLIKIERVCMQIHAAFFAIVKCGVL